MDYIKNKDYNPDSNGSEMKEHSHDGHDHEHGHDHDHSH
jgi:hypothetical protein